ncbi:unnamed protein product, partial [Polarella glacialis]
VLDATMTLDGYTLTDYQLLAQSPLASSTRASVVNYVRVPLAFMKQLDAGVVGHITILAPASSKVLCQQFEDLSGGGSLTQSLPLSTTIGVYGSHSCQLQNSLTMHLDVTRPIRAGSYVLQLGVLNPGIRAAKDYWTIELLPVVAANMTSANSTGANSSQVANDWRTATALARVQVNGFGVSAPFTGPVISPFISSTVRQVLSPASLLFTASLLLTPLIYS